MEEKDNVTIQIECSPEAASVIVPILSAAKMLGELQSSNYCCFYVDSERFRITKLEADGIYIERCIISAAAGFAYKIQDQLYKRFPVEHISLVDHGDHTFPDADAPKKKNLTMRRIDMETTF